MTEFERDLALHMQTCVSFGLNWRAERIVASLAHRRTGAPLTAREARALIAIAWRYRGQIARGYQPAIYLFQNDYLAGEASAGGGCAVWAARAASSHSHDHDRPATAIPPPLQGRGDNEGLPLWSRVSSSGGCQQ